MVMRLPPGPRAPRLYQTLRWMRSPNAFAEDCARRFGDAFTLRLLHFGPFVFFHDPEVARRIFAESEAFLTGEANNILEPFLGSSSLLLIDGERHRRGRAILTPPFQGERMRLYGPAILARTREALTGLADGARFTAHPLCQRISLLIILEAVFGLTEPARRDRFAAEIENLLNRDFGLASMFIPALQRDLGPLTPWRAFKRQLARVDALIRDEVARRRGAAARGEDILGRLLSVSGEDSFSDDELRDQLLTLLLAGHETTASALAFALHWVHADPAVLARLRAELAAAAVLDDPEAIAALPFLDAVCKETLRLIPIVNLIARKPRVSIELGGFQFEPGDLLAVSVHLVHRRPEIYPEPEVFRPERFLERRFAPHEFLPFGGGNRRCIGASFALYEMKLVLAAILAAFELELGRPGPLAVERRSVTMAPKYGVPLRITARRGARV